MRHYGESFSPYRSMPQYQQGFYGQDNRAKQQPSHHSNYESDYNYNYSYRYGSDYDYSCRDNYSSRNEYNHQRQDHHSRPDYQRQEPSVDDKVSQLEKAMMSMANNVANMSENMNKFIRRSEDEMHDFRKQCEADNNSRWESIKNLEQQIAQLVKLMEEKPIDASFANADLTMMEQASVESETAPIRQLQLEELDEYLDLTIPVNTSSDIMDTMVEFDEVAKAPLVSDMPYPIQIKPTDKYISDSYNLLKIMLIDLPIADDDSHGTEFMREALPRKRNSWMILPHACGVNFVHPIDHPRKIFDPGGKLQSS